MIEKLVDGHAQLELECLMAERLSFLELPLLNVGNMLVIFAT